MWNLNSQDIQEAQLNKPSSPHVKPVYRYPNDDWSTVLPVRIKGADAQSVMLA